MTWNADNNEEPEPEIMIMNSVGRGRRGTVSSYVIATFKIEKRDKALLQIVAKAAGIPVSELLRYAVKKLLYELCMVNMEPEPPRNLKEVAKSMKCDRFNTS